MPSKMVHRKDKVKYSNADLLKMRDWLEKEITLMLTTHQVGSRSVKQLKRDHRYITSELKKRGM